MGSDRRPYPQRHPHRRRRRRDPGAAADLVKRFQRKAGGGPGAPAGSVGPLAAAWVQVVGDVAAGHSVPVRRSRAGVVSVACSSSAWAQELTARREDLAERLRQACPDQAITGMRFSVADHVVAPAGIPPERPPQRPAPRVEQSDLDAGEHAAEGIADDSIRSLVARAAAAASARMNHPPNPFK